MTATFEVLLEAFGLKRSARENDLEVPLRLRVSEETLGELNALEAFLQGHGFRDVSRSSLVRAAISSYLEGVRSEVPEALIPPEQKLSSTR